MHSNHIDMSRGLESIPVLLYEGDSSNGVPALDKSYTYLRSFGIHNLVTINEMQIVSLVSKTNNQV